MEKIIKELEQKKSELLKDISSAENWILKRIDGAKPKTLSSGNVYWYDKDGDWLFTQHFKDGWLELSRVNVWVVLREEFTLNRDEILELLTNLLYDYTDNGKLKIGYLWEPL